MADFQKSSKKLLWTYSLIILAIGIVIGFFIGRSGLRTIIPSGISLDRQLQLNCKTCAQIRTCDEAKRLLAAGCLDLDKDKDGLPCESLCKKK